jgi:hypothetical protein
MPWHIPPPQLAQPPLQPEPLHPLPPRRQPLGPQLSSPTQQPSAPQQPSVQQGSPQQGSQQTPHPGSQHPHSGSQQPHSGSQHTPQPGSQQVSQQPSAEHCIVSLHKLRWIFGRGARCDVSTPHAWPLRPIIRFPAQPVVASESMATTHKNCFIRNPPESEAVRCSGVGGENPIFLTRSGRRGSKRAVGNNLVKLVSAEESAESNNSAELP